MGKPMATTRATTTQRPPTHPGAILRDDVLPALGLSVSEAARRLGISRQMLHDLLGERRGFSAGMALRVGKLAGNGPALWLSMQQAFDLWHAERELSRELASIAPARSVRATMLEIREPRSMYAQRAAGRRAR
jgi:antitoxin HigA-1